ncbi:hypothetical protein [Cyanobium gracile]|uniref:Uncharacterized protein n=1 Tax=Cyanobium gracile UHCC 0281 TaxID=3110309 RepID=A0ABU5SSR4_9CYAN|nr:hypothetical protein [Cyanobium gracile]MEA5441468.1 hypothetical protein [Cyanobium gracile UHCC 0281]
MQTSNGSSARFGATVTPEAVNVCAYSNFAIQVERRRFDRQNAAVPDLVVELDPVGQRTYQHWHGPWQPERGLHVDGRHLLLDLYGLGDPLLR